MAENQPLKTRYSSPPGDAQDLSERIEAGVKHAVALALVEHRRAGRSVVVWQDGQVVTLAPDEIPIPPEYEHLLHSK